MSHSCLVFLQLPATLKSGVTVVISPLLSLIQDQIITLNLKFGIPATFLNSQQTVSQAAAVLQELRQGLVLSQHCEQLGDLFFFPLLIFSSYDHYAGQSNPGSLSEDLCRSCFSDLLQYFSFVLKFVEENAVHVPMQPYYISIFLCPLCLTRFSPSIDFCTYMCF